ncbi:ATP synthase F1 subunit gamma [Candidatus Sulfidibacterium hydrothermale]|uniref:ATP synthase F1 subunit gamma n=1 Tax=Candidatus Sulfidibacterium hydrothermale TaxID=2875962 RepID=UPI001F0A165B|nr:ATP synthase F1 subunit gamma [Candidatus Sulfidibacterium hydrothermale]UBM62285.1 ATP synthase F1 subunit gamma [Candidatus Sulfidibacterium hydrothermale]
MANLKEIRTRITSVQSTMQITSAMKMVAAAKLRKAQNAVTTMRPYAAKLQEIMQDLSASLEGSNENIFTTDREPEKVLLVAITSNRGLCGAFNANVVKEVIQLTRTTYTSQTKNGKLDIFCIGKKGADTLKARGFTVKEIETAIFDQLNFEKAVPLAEKMMQQFADGEYDRIVLVYNQFKNAAVQILQTEQFLPVQESKPDESGEKNHKQADYIFEPGKEEIINALIPKTLKVQFYKALLDSFAAEHGARMTAMHQATDNATALLKDLKLTYNKARQASITNEILEIAGAAEALKG